EGVGGGELQSSWPDTMGACGREVGSAGAGIEYRFFALLHLDGEDLIDRPLTDRLAALERIAGPWRIPGVVTADVGAAERVLEESLATGHEGVMVKDAGSSYESGRRGGARSEEHTSELQSREKLVCRLLLE